MASENDESELRDKDEDSAKTYDQEVDELREAELRMSIKREARDGVYYTYGEFLTHYGVDWGDKEWKFADVGDDTKSVYRRARDGGYYTYKEFVFKYGKEPGEKEWNLAAGASVCRRARDGVNYTYEEFAVKYGKGSVPIERYEQWELEWNLASPRNLRNKLFADEDEVCSVDNLDKSAT